MQKEVTLGLGGSQRVTFLVTPNVAGTYQVSLNGLSGGFNALPAPPAEITVDSLTVRPSVISLGETVYIDCQCICNVPGTYPVQCVIDGTTLILDFTFSETQVWSYRTFEYTPTNVGTYTITILGVSKELIVKEKPMEPFEYLYWSFYTDDTITIEITCPFCHYVIRSVGSAYDEAEIRDGLVAEMYDHIGSQHHLVCPICGEDFTYATEAAERGNNWATHLASVHGKTIPQIEVTPLYQCYWRGWPEYSSDYYDTYWDGGRAEKGKESLDKSSIWINRFNGTMITPSPGYYIYNPIDSRTGAIKFRVPILAGKAWTLKFATWREGEDVSVGPDREWECSESYSGTGELIKIAEGPYIGYGNSITAIIQYDSEVLIIPNLYVSQYRAGGARLRENPNFAELWNDP